MKKLGLLILFILLTFQLINAQVAPNQGDVVINTFDTRYGGVAGTEFVVLVNRTNSTIDLNGFEFKSFAVSGNTSGFSVVWIFRQLCYRIPFYW